MYRCPKCASEESLYADGEFSFLGWVRLDNNGEVINMHHIDKQGIFKFNEMQCDKCSYKAPADEFEV